MLGSPRAGLKFFTIDPYTERILFQDKKFCSTILDYLFAGKLKIRWSRPFMIHTILSHGAVEISDLKSGQIFKVNG